MKEKAIPDDKAPRIFPQVRFWSVIYQCVNTSSLFLSEIKLWLIQKVKCGVKEQVVMVVFTTWDAWKVIVIFTVGVSLTTSNHKFLLEYTE